MAKMRMKGKVVRSKSDKTVTVRVSQRRAHPKYGKTIVRHKDYQVHSSEPVEAGTDVLIEEVRPISKSKRFKIAQVLNNKDKNGSAK